MLTSVVGIVILLGGLIFFHELGHYLVAKMFNVKVETFSLGFGKKLFIKKWGETEYCLSLIPLGGYVKLMGDDPYHGVPSTETERAFATQKLYKRFLIVAAGPIFNLVLAFFLFAVIFWVGKPMVGTRLGAVLPQSTAWESGLRPQDKITQLDGKPTANWSEVENFLRDRVDQKVEVTVERKGSELHFPIEVQKVAGRSPYGEPILVGGLKGISPYPLSSKIGVSQPRSIAYHSGLRTGDRVVKVGAESVKTFEQLVAAISPYWEQKKPVTVTVEREPIGEKAETKSITMEWSSPAEKELLNPLDVLGPTGIFPADLFVREITAASPAEKAGLHPGDRILSVNGTPIYGFDSMVEQVQLAGENGKSMDIVVVREGHGVQLSIAPAQTSTEDPLTHAAIKRYMIGFSPQTEVEEAEIVLLQIRQVGDLIHRAVSETYDMAYKMVVSIVKLATGSISVKNLGGPVLIASIAGKSLDAGIIPFLQTMALISINLFLLNLLPIPVLDGGHLLFFLIEGIKGKPVSLKTVEIATQIGMVFILLLVALTFFNDISRILFN